MEDGMHAMDTISRDAVNSASTDTIPLDIAALRFLRARLCVEDMGRLHVQIARAATVQRPSELQRLLLAIVSHTGGDHA